MTAPNRIWSEGGVEYIRADLVDPKPATTCPHWCGRCDDQVVGRQCCTGPAHRIDCDCGGRPVDADCHDCDDVCCHPRGVTGPHCPHCADRGVCAYVMRGICTTCAAAVR